MKVNKLNQSNEEKGVPRERSKIGFFEKLFLNVLTSSTNSALKLVYFSGEEYFIGNPEEGDPAEIKVLDQKFFKQVVLYGDIGLGEAYFLGYWTSSDLVKSLNWFVENSDTSPSFSNQVIRNYAINLLGFIDSWYHRLRPNNKKKAAENISLHYDLSNELYKCMLDPSMAYSAAFFEKNTDSLFQAQQNKFKMIASKLSLNANDHLLEIGSGWGGFALYAAGNYHCRVTTITISKEQYEYTQREINKRSLQDLIEVKLLDFRDLTGKFDKIVSIEMAEALGKKYLKPYFEQLNKLLAKSGIAVLQLINYPESDYEKYRKRTDFIQRHIFPGSELLSIHEIVKTLHNTGDLCLYDLESMGLHYAKTLQRWAENFSSSRDKLLSLGFDEIFIKKWTYYMAYCETGFMSRYINVVQLVLSRSQNRSIVDYHSFPM
jgi:cyclopropane-fatty-acyl-phospholipid synthase